MQKFYYLPNDGLVPRDSGQFLRENLGKNTLLKGYDHLHMKDDRNILPELFDMIKEDLEQLISISTVTANFQASPTSGRPPLTVKYDNLSTAKNTSIISWRWDFDNNGVIDSELENPTWSYNDAGVYTVNLTVSDGILADTEEKVDYILVTNSYEPNNSFSTATPIQVGMTHQTHSVEASDDIDYLRFNAIQGYGYTVRLEHETGVGVEFIVYDHLQNRLSSDWGSNQFHYVCSATGINYIKVYRDGNREDGNYTIRVLPAYWNGDTQLTWNEYHEPNPTWYNAPLLKTDGTEYFNKIEYSEDEDYFRFTASKNNTYTISLTEENGSGVEFILYFENENHNLERISSDWGSNSYEFNCTHTGNYIIKVYRDGGLTEGDYKINVRDNLSTIVKLSIFSANQVDNGIILTWIAKTESNVYGYEIERNKGQNWEKLSFIKYIFDNKNGKYEYVDNVLSFSRDEANFKYRLKQIYLDGSHSYSNIISIELEMPKEFVLFQNYPNPFNPKTTVTFKIKEKCKVILKVFDINGREVATLVNKEYIPGKYQVIFDGKDLPSGVYLYLIWMNNFKAMRKMILLE